MSWLQPTSIDENLITHMRVQMLDVLRLAKHLAPALRIEPRLLRNARLAYLPETDAGLEAAFWRCPLVESHSARGLTLRPGVARLLTDELSVNSVEFDEHLKRIEANTAHWSLRERLEQSLRWDARDTGGALTQIQQKLREVLREIIRTNEADKRRDIARWIKGAIPGSYNALEQLPEANWLTQFAAATLGDPGGILARQWKDGEPLPAWLHTMIPASTALETFAIGLRWRPGILECVAADQSKHTLLLSAPFPAPIFLQDEDNDDPGRWELVWPDCRIIVKTSCRNLLIRLLTGQTYRLRLQNVDEFPNAQEWDNSGVNIEHKSDYGSGNSQGPDEVSKVNHSITELLWELDDYKTHHERRLKIGNELARLGDPRKGVGLNNSGLPDIDLVKIPSGKFLYGEGEEKQTLTLPAFYIARYPITNAQFLAFIEDGGYDAKAPWWRGFENQRERSPEKPRWTHFNRPRTDVSWYEAVAFCRWLSGRLKYEPKSGDYPIPVGINMTF